jgi:hypothetical protein
MVPSLEKRLVDSLADYVAFARIGQMIEDVLDEGRAHLDLDGPTYVGESYRDTLIDV